MSVKFQTGKSNQIRIMIVNSILLLVLGFTINSASHFFPQMGLPAIIPTVYAEPVELTSNPSFRLAWTNINKAEESGANVGELLVRFGNAMELVRQAEDMDFRTCNSYNECIEDANTIFISVSSDALLLESESRHAGEQNILNTAMSSALGALPVAFFGMYIYKKWEAYKLEKFYRKEIGLKKEP